MDWFSDFLSDVGGIVSTTNYWLGILTSFAVIFVHHRIKIPKLVVTGSGGSGGFVDGKTDGERFSTYQMHLVNSPSFLGYPVNRETLSVASGRIYDPEKKTYEGPLMRWQGTPENEPYSTQIKVGERAQLFVYGVYKQRVHYYAGNTLHNIDLSETLIELGESRKLEIHVRDTLQRCYKIPFRIFAEERRNNIQKVQVSVRVKTTFTDRLGDFKSGFQIMISSFTRPSY